MDESTRVLKQMLERYIDSHGYPAVGDILVDILTSREARILGQQLTDYEKSENFDNAETAPRS